MTPRSAIRLVATATLVALCASGCERDTEGLPLAPFDTDPVVFDDAFGATLDYQAFLNSKLDAVSIDTSEKHSGSASIKVTVPGPNDPPVGGFAGGAFATRVPRDLSGYNAVTFWAKASKPATLNEVGLGVDVYGKSRFQARRTDVPLTTSWAPYVVPIPLPGKLRAETGLLYLSEGYENNAGYQFWLDDIRLEYVPGITNPRPAMSTPAQPQGTFVGATVTVQGTRTTFAVSGTDMVVQHGPAYFTFASSDEAVVRVTGDEIRAVGVGSAALTAKLGSIDVPGSVALTATAPPSIPAPVPTVDTANVIALFSSAYPSVGVYNWMAFGSATVTDLQVAGDAVKAYTNLTTYAGIAFMPPPPSPPPVPPTPQIDATEMTHFHLDIWLPDATVFKVKLVDFGEDGRYGGAPDSEYELSFNASSDPPLVNDSWVALEIPLASFTGLVGRAHLAQLIISMTGNEKTVFLDNIYFHK